MKVYGRHIRKPLILLRVTLLLLVLLTYVTFRIGKSDYSIVLFFFLICFGFIPVVNVEIFTDKIKIEKIYFFGLIKSGFLFEINIPVKLTEFYVVYYDRGFVRYRVKKYIIKQSFEDKIILLTEVRLSEAEVELIQQQIRGKDNPPKI